MWPVPRRRKGATNSGAELAHAAFAQAVACRLRAAAVIGYREKTAAAAFFSSLKSLELHGYRKKTAAACDGRFGVNKCKSTAAHYRALIV